MEIHDSGSIKGVPQQFSIEHTDVSHEPTVAERTNSIANEPLNESGKLFNPQNESPRLSRKVSPGIPHKSANVSGRTASEGPKRIQIPSNAKRMSQVRGSLPPVPPPRPDRPLGAAGLKPKEGIESPSIDQAKLDRATNKGRPVIKEMASTEKSYSESLNRLVSRDYKGKSVLSRLADLASPADKKIIENYRDSTRAHLKHSQKLLANLEKNAKTADTDFAKGLKDASDSYSKMGDYIDTNVTLSLQFSDMQKALARTKAANPKEFEKLENQFKEGKTIVRNGVEVEDKRGFSDMISQPHQRLPRHEMLTGALVKDTPMEMEGAESVKIAETNFAYGGKTFEAKKMGINNLAEVQAGAISPKEESIHPASQEFFKSIAAGDEKSKTGLIYGANAVWSKEGFKGVSAFDQISLAYSSAATPNEKKAIAGALKDMLEANASLPISNEAKAHAKGVVYDLVLKTLADGNDVASQLKTLADKNLAPTPPKSAAEKGGELPDVNSVNSNLDDISKMYDLASANPADSYQNIRTFVFDALTDLNLSDLDFQGSADATTLQPTIDRYSASIALVTNMIAQSPNPQKAYDNAIKMLAMAQKDEAAGMVSLLTTVCNSPAIKGARYLNLPRSNSQQAIIDKEFKSTVSYQLMNNATSTNKAGMPEMTVILSMLENNRQGNQLREGEELNFIQDRLGAASDVKKTFVRSLENAGKAQTQKPLPSSYGQFKTAGDSMLKLFDQLGKTEYERPRDQDGFPNMDQPRRLQPLYEGKEPNAMGVFTELMYARLQKK